MLKNLKITTKLLIVILLITLGTLFVVSVVSYTQLLDTTTYLSGENANLGLTSSAKSKKALLSQSEEYLTMLGEVRGSATDKTLAGIRTKVTEMSEFVTDLYANSENFDGRELPLPDQTEMGVASAKYMLAPGVVMTDELNRELLLISNAEYAFEPVLVNDEMLDNVYLGTESGISFRFSRSNLYNPDYDPRARGWYSAAVENPDGPVWLDTYKDSYGSVCITCAQAFFNADGKIGGVVAMDITLQHVVDEILGMTIGSSGYAFILDKNMNFIAHPTYALDEETVSLRDHIDASDSSGFNAIKGHKGGIEKMSIDGVERYVAYANLSETGWKICLTIDVDEIIQPANETKAEIDEATDVAQKSIQKMLKGVITKYVIMFAAIGIIVIVLAFAIAGTISKPILKLADVAQEIGHGNLEVKAPVISNDEVGELAKTINSMTDNLQSHITQLTTITADKERIETELDVATNIQKSMLPCIFPAFTDRKEFAIFATMDPAKEVGGDFYDFFMVDKTHLAVVVADVSGKGVPAALFMVIGKTLIKDHTKPGQDLGSVFSEVNNLLCESNSEGMFITAFEGVLDLVSGEFVFVNAGHEMPFVYRKGGSFEPYKIRPGFVLAGMEDMKYRGGVMTLEVGDKLFQYTDGVTEATDANNELYGMERLEAVLNREKLVSPEALLPKVKEDIDAFVGEAPQFDDITMLCIEIKARMEVDTDDRA